jgi:NAD+ synthase (glutamine-hydrolysing)
MDFINKIQLYQAYEKLQTAQNFNAAEYVKGKIAAINAFFREDRLDACVLGLSGGVDSATVAMLLQKAMSEPQSPLKRVAVLSLPIHSVGTSGQEEAVGLAEFAASRFSHSGMSFETFNGASSACASIARLVPQASSWAVGQLASICRTPVLYFKAACLQDLGYKSLVVGTTNKTESLIGFYGKASDAMVDLQIIEDIHKSEVLLVADFLCMPREIEARVPCGDVWDGRTDEQMIGAPYWLVELYLSNAENAALCRSLAPDETGRLEKLMAQNFHKTKVGRPSRTI